MKKSGDQLCQSDYNKITTYECTNSFTFSLTQFTNLKEQYTWKIIFLVESFIGQIIKTKMTL